VEVVVNRTAAALLAFVVSSAVSAHSARAALAASASAPSPAPPASSPAASPKIEFEQYTLPNGLHVILHVDRKLPIVNVNQWFHVGSKNEKPGRTGFAHLFEHLMFQGSLHASEEYFGFVEKAGANLREGGVNGTTNTDRTNFFATVPSGNLEHLLWIESDRLATLAEAIDQKKLDNQREVVKNERRQSLENQPYGRWYELVAQNLFPAGHPYSWSVIGSMDDLNAASLADVQEFFRTYYAPNNLSLVVAGDFDVAQAKQLIERYFGPIAPGPPLARPGRFPIALAAEKVVEVADRVPQERVYLVWPTPEIYADGDAALDLAARVLSDGLSSRLNKRLVYDQQLASDVNSFQYSQEIAGIFAVIATARPGVSLGELETIVGEEIARLAKSGPTAAELQRAKTKQEFQFISGLEQIGGFGGKADVLNQYQTFLGDPGRFEWDLERYRKLGPGDVQSAVARYLDTSKRLVLRFHPERSSRPPEGAANALDRNAMPPYGADRRFVAPAVEHATLANGLELFVVERADLPKIAAHLVTRAGAIADPPGKAGLATLTASTLDLGTATRKALAIEDALGDLGTELNLFAAREATYLNFEVLARNFEPTLAIVADVVQHPSFPADEVERERKRQLDQLGQLEKNGTAVASRVRSILAFGAEHPYGRPVQGLPASVATLTRDDVAAFHSLRYRPASTALVLVGALKLADAVALAERQFGAWSGGAAPEIAIPAPQPAAAGKIYLVDRQDAAQSVISQFLAAPARGSGDDDALQMADEIWGASAGSRLNTKLRQEKGYAYGAFSGLAQFRNGGLWYGGGGVQTDKTKESVAEMLGELYGLAGAKPMAPEEYGSAQLRRVRGYAQRFESFSRVAEEVATLWVLGQPMSELQGQVDRIAALDAGAAQAAAAKWANPAGAAMVVVGDRAKIEAGLKEAGEVVLLDSEGRKVE
jgi:zinc protease